MASKLPKDEQPTTSSVQETPAEQEYKDLLKKLQDLKNEINRKDMKTLTDEGRKTTEHGEHTEEFAVDLIVTMKEKFNKLVAESELLPLCDPKKEINKIIEDIQKVFDDCGINSETGQRKRRAESTSDEDAGTEAKKSCPAKSDDE